jgi:hypothetical protein
MTNKVRLAAVLAGMVVAGATSYAAVQFWGASDWGSPFCCATGRGAAGAITLDPNLFPGEPHQAYLVAQSHPDLLAQLRCYCGCERDAGHRSLLDCFRSKHGSICPICMGEAVEAGRLTAQGVPVEQIRDLLRSRYASKS